MYIDNFFQELDKIQKLITDYPYIAMVSPFWLIFQDTEFPGDVFEDDTSQVSPSSLIFLVPHGIFKRQ